MSRRTRKHVIQKRVAGPGNAESLTHVNNRCSFLLSTAQERHLTTGAWTLDTTTYTGHLDIGDIIHRIGTGLDHSGIDIEELKHHTQEKHPIRTFATDTEDIRIADSNIAR